MSSILKALKKVEEEKRVANHAAPDLRYEQGTSPGKSKPYMALLAGVALGMIAVGSFFVFVQKADNFNPATEVLSVQKTPVASEQERPGPPFNENVPVVTLPPEPVSVQTPAVTSAPLRLSAAPASTFKKPVAQRSTKTDSPPPVVTEKPQAVTTQPARQLPAGVALNVSEIFYQKEQVNSMAVVNDLPVMVGTYVESAVVTEIFPDQVLFKIGEHTYAIPVSTP
jgi:general secretion pathway protein B